MDHFKLLRPQQWLKNLFVFMPVFFAGDIFAWDLTFKVGAVFAAFCFLTGGTYIINDIVDLNKDRLHPLKKFRPIASGRVTIASALILSGLLFLCACLIVICWIPATFPLFVVYLVLATVYTFYLKNVMIADLVSITFFYNLRILAGAKAADIPVSPWMLLCVFFLTLFIIIGKRRSEFGHANRRPVLRYYSVSILDLFLKISGALTLMTYLLYTLLGPLPLWSLLSILFVFLGFLRYRHCIAHSLEAESPEKLILRDKILAADILLWLSFMFIIVYQ